LPDIVNNPDALSPCPAKNCLREESAPGFEGSGPAFAFLEFLVKVQQK